MPNDITVQPLVYNGEIITQRDQMVSLTDMWKASGSDESKRPADWARKDGSEFIAHVAEFLNMPHGHIQTKRGGSGAGRGATYAHWQIALAYAKYLSPEFHMWCNTVVRERMEGKTVSIATLPPDVLEMIRRSDGIDRMLAHKVTGMEATVQALATAVATIATTMRPPADGIYVSGRTAGEIWKAAGFPPIKITSWFSNRLAKMGCQVDGCRRAPVGTSRAKLFDADKAENWLRNGGGRTLVEQYVAERRGQSVIPFPRVVPSAPLQPSA